MNHLPRFRVVTLGLAVLPIILGACATKAKKAMLTPLVIDDKVVTTEYEYVTPTGSNIPIKVPKGGQPLATASAVQTMSPETFRELVNRPGGRRR